MPLDSCRRSNERTGTPFNFIEKRDMEAAKAFFAEAHEVAGQSPQREVTDELASYPRVIAKNWV